MYLCLYLFFFFLDFLTWEILRIHPYLCRYPQKTLLSSAQGQNVFLLLLLTHFLFRTKRRKSRVILIVGIRIDQTISHVFVLGDAAHKGRETSPRVCPSHLIKTLQTGSMQTNSWGIYSLPSFLTHVQWMSRSSPQDNIWMIYFLKCVKVEFQSHTAAQESACRSVIQLKIFLNWLKSECPAQCKH